VASDVNFRMVVTRVLKDQHYFVEHMEVASDVSFRMVVTRVQRDQPCFA
jgi:hypothetical protein